MAKGPIGLNTEADTRALPRGGHPQFMNVRYEGGVIRPRKPNGTYTAPTGTELWLFEQLGVSDVAELHIEADTKWHAYCALDASGGVTVRDPSGNKYQATLPAPTDGPTHGRTVYSNGSVPSVNEPIALGDSRTYYAAWATDQDGYYYSGISADSVTITNDYGALYVTTTIAPTDLPANGDTITNTTTGATATCYGVYYATTLRIIYVKQSSKSVSGLWSSGDAVSWGSISTTLSAAESQGDVAVSIAAPATVPSGATYWYLLALGDAGYYYVVGGPNAVSSEAIDQKDSIEDGTEYEGPLDVDNLPETLVHLPDVGNTNAVAMHKECLFVAIGDEIFMSEPTDYRRFRSGYSLRARGTVMKMISRRYGLDAILQVFTDRGVDIIVGSPPYFEIRPTGINEAPSSQLSIIDSDVGTWALYDDGWYVMAGVERKNVTLGVNTPWIDAISDKTAVVSGASKGVAYLVDDTGRTLAYDWEQRQFYESEYTTQPDGFRWSDTSRVLVAKIGSSYETVEAGTGDVSWAVEYETEGGFVDSLSPSGVVLDIDGEITLSYYVEDDIVYSETFDPSDDPDGYSPLPQDRGRDWHVVLSGSGTHDDTVLRGVAFVP